MGQDLNMTPRYHSPAAFDKYKPHILKALSIYPGPLRVDLSTSVETFAARFRDAHKAAVTNGWLLDGRPLSVAMRSGYVLIGTPEAIRAYDSIPPSSKPETQDIEVDFSDDAVAHCLCRVIEAGAFRTPVAFTVGPLTPEQVKTLETAYHVTLVPIPERPNTYTLL